MAVNNFGQVTGYSFTDSKDKMGIFHSHLNASL
jgi:hypothetical protein